MPTITEFIDIKWTLNEKENIWIGYSENLDLKNMGFIYAKLFPDQELKTHYHERPDKGDEMFIFNQKGHIELKTVEEGKIKTEEYRTSAENPIHISFKDREIHGIKNIGKEPVIFLAAYAPLFQDGEVKHY